MGQVFVRLTITNAIDAGMARRGMLQPDEVRSAVADSALVDTGATHLSLPADIIRALGLELDREL
ncbi:MAG: aspartyl protease, partial [Anaerolinea sp.]|nr:aspartyl protease [Anaerolinea sp.]